MNFLWDQNVWHYQIQSDPSKNMPHWINAQPFCIVEAADFTLRNFIGSTGPAGEIMKSMSGASSPLQHGEGRFRRIWPTIWQTPSSSSFPSNQKVHAHTHTLAHILIWLHTFFLRCNCMHACPLFLTSRKQLDWGWLGPQVWFVGHSTPKLLKTGWLRDPRTRWAFRWWMVGFPAMFDDQRLVPSRHGSHHFSLDMVAEPVELWEPAPRKALTCIQGVSHIQTHTGASFN